MGKDLWFSNIWIPSSTLSTYSKVFWLACFLTRSQSSHHFAFCEHLVVSTGKLVDCMNSALSWASKTSFVFHQFTVGPHHFVNCCSWVFLLSAQLCLPVTWSHPAYIPPLLAGDLLMFWVSLLPCMLCSQNIYANLYFTMWKIYINISGLVIH